MNEWTGVCSRNLGGTKKLAEVDKLQVIGWRWMVLRDAKIRGFCWSVPGLNGMWKGPVSIDILWNTWNLKTWKHTFCWSVESSRWENSQGMIQYKYICFWYTTFKYLCIYVWRNLMFAQDHLRQIHKVNGMCPMVAWRQPGFAKVYSPTAKPAPTLKHQSYSPISA